MAGQLTITCKWNMSGGHLWNSHVLSADGDAVILGHFPSPFDPYYKYLDVHAPSDNEIPSLGLLGTPLSVAIASTHIQPSQNLWAIESTPSSLPLSSPVGMNLVSM